MAHAEAVLAAPVVVAPAPAPGKRAAFDASAFLPLAPAAAPAPAPVAPSPEQTVNIPRIGLLKDRLSAAWIKIEELKHSPTSMDRVHATQLEDMISPASIASMFGELGLVSLQLDSAEQKLVPCQKLLVAMEKSAPEDPHILALKADCKWQCKTAPLNGGTYIKKRRVKVHHCFLSINR